MSAPPMSAPSLSAPSGAVPRRGLFEALTALLEFAGLDPLGLDVVDVGCGEGAVVRHLAGLGANALGVEPREARLESARAYPPAGGEAYRLGRGEELPLDAASVDLVLYVNSLHHLPTNAMTPALAEAARVLRPGGRLGVIEPLPEGAFFAVTRLMEDETAARAAALAALQAPPAGLAPESESFYLATMRYRDPEALMERMVAIDPRRRARLPAIEAAARQAFAEFGRVEGAETAFDQPMRVNLLHRAG